MSSDVSMAAASVDQMALTTAVSMADQTVASREQTMVVSRVAGLELC